MKSASFRNLVLLIIGEYGDGTEYQPGQEGKSGGRGLVGLRLWKKSSSAKLKSSVTVGTSLLQ